MTVTKISRAAIYARSSKDRSDVSIDAQRRQLQQLATERGFTLVAEFADVVESGKDEFREGFQKLIAAVRNKKRGWDTLLILDTSRLARRRHISMIFEEVEAKKHGVTIVYKSVPDSDPITGMLLKSILQAMDEWHSLTSRQKGLAGMAENVRQGWRAGGRAPMGYQLEHTATGAIREGAPVTKSKLVLGDDAAALKSYLVKRAAGMNRTAAAAEAGIKSAGSTLVGVEWNALTYAGHTPWNVRHEHGNGGYIGGVKRRPRNEWIVQRNTHEALIDDDQAEIILRRLESFDRGHHSHGDYLLTGLLKTPDGANWSGSDSGDGGYYRVGKGKRIKASTIEEAVVQQIGIDLVLPDFIEAATAAIKKRFDDRRRDDAIPTLRKEAADLERRIKRLTDMLADTSQPEPLLRQIEGYEVRRVAIEEDLVIREAEALESAKVRSMGQNQVARLAREIADGCKATDRAVLRESLLLVVDRVLLDPVGGECKIRYNLTGITGVRMASPRGSESNPGFEWSKFNPRRAA